MADEVTKQKKTRLASYINLKMEVSNQRERIQRMKANETLPAQKESDGSQHTPGASDRMANAIIRRMSYEEKVLPQIRAAVAEMEAIEDWIDALRDPLEREVLRLRYIDGEHCRLQKWPEVALIMYGDNDEPHMQAVFRIHGRALKNLQDVRSYDTFGG